MTPDPYAPTSGDANVRALHYDLSLNYKVSTNRLDGEAVVHLEALAPLREIRLDLVGLNASKVRISGEKRSRFRQGARKLTVTPQSPIAAGQRFDITVRYSGRPEPRNSRWGRVGWEELEDGVLVGSQPVGAPTWYPCNDRVDDRATYHLDLTCEDGYTVVAPGIQTARLPGSGKCRWTFDEQVPTPTYLVAVHIGRYRSEPLDLGSVPAAVHLPPALADAVHTELAPLAEMMTTFESAFGPYPLQRYDVVVTADELEIPLEGQGMAVFGANHLDGSHALERLVAHELAHQWFGNSVGLATWQDIWLNEGFACYAEWLWSEASGSLSCHRQARRHWDLLSTLPQDLVLADPTADGMFDDRVYKRGALTLHALRLTIGDDAFFGVLRRWTAIKQHAIGTTAEFRALAQECHGTGLSDLFDRWLCQPALPHLPRVPTEPAAIRSTARPR